MAASRHVEKQFVPGRRLGRRPRDESRPLLKLGDYLTGALPAHPPSVDYFSRVPNWILGGNDKFGTCGPTSLANHLLLVSTWLADAPITVTDNDVYDLYRRSGNPQFNPTTGADDNGVDMTVMLSAAVKGGIGGYKPLAFAAVNGSDPTEVRTAGAIFGGTLWGVDLDVAQQQQTNTKAAWDYVSGSRDWGGHAIMAAARYSEFTNTILDRTGLISWILELDATDLFMSRQLQERYIVIWPWHLGTKAFQENIDLTALAADYQALTGRPFPAVTPTPTPPAPTPVPPGPTPTPPAPTPGPCVDAADRALATVLRPLATQTPRWWSRTDPALITAARTWITAKGL